MRKPITKECPNCHGEFPETPDYFYRKANKKPGFLARCKPCIKGTTHRRYTEGGATIFFEKACAKCEVVKECTNENFPPHRSGKGGLSSWCRDCSKIYNNARYYRALGDSRTKYWAPRIVLGARGTAKKKKLPFDLDTEFVLGLFEEQKGLCYWFGIPIFPNPGTRDPQRPSLDKLVPEKGYVKGNVVLTCAAANMGRSNTSVERFAEFCSLLRSTYVSEQVA
jgi:hypothetical protein